MKKKISFFLDRRQIRRLKRRSDKGTEMLFSQNSVVYVAGGVYQVYQKHGKSRKRARAKEKR